MAQDNEIMETAWKHPYSALWWRSAKCGIPYLRLACRARAKVCKQHPWKRLAFDFGEGVASGPSECFIIINPLLLQDVRTQFAESRGICRFPDFTTHATLSRRITTMDTTIPPSKHHSFKRTSQDIVGSAGLHVHGMDNDIDSWIERARPFGF